MIVRKSASVRRGLSLLEVLVSLAIFLMSLIAISQIVDVGVNMSQDMEMRSHAAMLAQTQLARVVSGELALTSVGDTPCEGDDGDWNWCMDAEQDAAASLYRVTVTVSREALGRKTEVAFSQYVLDPTKRGSTDATALGTDDTTSSTTGSTTTGGSP